MLKCCIENSEAMITYPAPLSAGWRLASGVWFADWSGVAELTDERDERTSETGATPKDVNISSRSLKGQICWIHSMV